MFDRYEKGRRRLRGTRLPVTAVCLAVLLLCLPTGGCGRGPVRPESADTGEEAVPLESADTAGEAVQSEDADEAGKAVRPENADTGEEALRPESAGAQGRRLRVAATIFPYYDLVRQIAGYAVELELIVPAGMDSHSFEPTPAHMRSIQNADLLICNGGAMEQWVGQVLDAAEAPDLTVVTMMDRVDTVQEEVVEGMEDGDHGHGYGESDGHGETGGNEGADDHGEEIEYDEHIWTSPVLAMEIVRVIADTLSEKDPAHVADYAAGAQACLEELQEIHEDFLAVSAERQRDMIIVADRFPFRYLTEEYGLTYRAAFSGCSTDTEPSARTIAYLIDQVREEKIPVVYYLELSSSRVAEIIGEETGARPLLLHSCHNVTRAQLEAGVTYAELMRQNVENLRKGIVESRAYRESEAGCRYLVNMREPRPSGGSLCREGTAPRPSGGPLCRWETAPHSSEGSLCREGTVPHPSEDSLCREENALRPSGESSCWEETISHPGGEQTWR